MRKAEVHQPETTHDQAASICQAKDFEESFSAFEAVSDSSRYFVLRIQDDSGRAAFIGVGFADRSDSFDLNVALQDHFKWLKQSQEIEKEGGSEEASKPRLDLSFKAGETIKINMNFGVH